MTTTQAVRNAKQVTRRSVQKASMTDLECFLYDLNRVRFGYAARPVAVETAIRYIYDEIRERKQMEQAA